MRTDQYVRYDAFESLQLLPDLLAGFLRRVGFSRGGIAVFAGLGGRFVTSGKFAGRSLRSARLRREGAAGLRRQSLRPANRCAIDTRQKARSRADAIKDEESGSSLRRVRTSGPADASSGPSRGEAAAR